MQHLLDRLTRDGGFTVDPCIDETPTMGFAVSLPGHEWRIPSREVSAELLDLYVDKHWILLTRPTGPCYLGAWRDGEYTYLDITQVYENREEAIATAKEAKQLAVYDLAKGESIDVAPRKEVWVASAGERCVGYVRPALDDDGTDNFLAWPSEEQAERGCAFQKDMYGIECTPVCLSTGK